MRLFAFFLRVVFSLRYKVDLEGIPPLLALKSKRSILFLPNHPAELDPIFLMSHLYKYFRPRPMVVEHFFYLKGAHLVMRLLNALPIPNIEGRINHWKTQQIEKLFAEVSKGLKEGENFLIYPAGRLKMSAREEIGGASFVHRLLKEVPETQIVLVRTRGLWGSSFSRAVTGKVPDFGKMLLKGAGILLKNGVFFAPRRPVHIELCLAPSDFPKGVSRLELNKYLEEWYNKVPDPLSLVPYTFWNREVPVVVEQEEQKVLDVKVTPEIEAKVMAFLSRLAKIPSSALRKEMHLSSDLGLDSLDVAEIYVFLNERFDVDHLAPGELQSVEDVLKAACGAYRRESVEQEEALKKSFSWPEEPERPPPFSPLGGTLQEAFLLAAERMGKYVACADALSGVLSYRKCKRAALILKEALEKLPGQYIGVLLPATSSCYLVILALLLAKKTPVLLNWTAGSRSLNYTEELLSFSTVLTSRRFLDKVHNGDLGKLIDKIVFLEDVKNRLSFKHKGKGLLLSLLPFARLEECLALDSVKETDPAVILFTSGTESFPKAVPLTHKNLLSNERAALSCVPVTKEDILFCSLPPFHSFGFSITGLLPLFSGFRCCFYPDPTESHGMASAISHFRPTILVLVPTFIQTLIKVASSEEMSSVRLVFSGAEKASQKMLSTLKTLLPFAKVIEGYGITECGPVVTMQRLDEEKQGVGRAIPGVSMCIVHPETRTLLQPMQEGEICIDGPNVFEGYLGNVASPFLVLQGKRWYRSGDLGHLDEKGNLILSGRLTRFVKIGGEMISLGAIEEELKHFSQEKGWCPRNVEKVFLALSVKERETDKPRLILFTTFEISLDSINAILKESGFGRLVKISEVRHIEQIPLTGTGKTHYRLLDEMVT